MPTVYKKTFKCIGNNSWMSSPGVNFNLTCGKGVTELQNLASLRLSSFAESYQMQQKNFDVSPKALCDMRENLKMILYIIIYRHTYMEDINDINETGE